MAIVSVSREEGTWGGDVARDLAARLGYRLLDKKALLEEAEAYGGISLAAPELLEKQPGPARTAGSGATALQHPAADRGVRRGAA